MSNGGIAIAVAQQAAAALITAQAGPQGIPGFGTAADLLAQTIFPGAKNQADSVTTTFNADGSITEVFTQIGLTRTTSFGTDGSITEAYTGTLTRTKTSTFSADGSITETIT